MKLVGRGWPLAVLMVQNLLIFWGHYFSGVGFPWDFPMGYYAVVAFWTSAVRMGVFPQWVPYQSMGYPLAMNLQSGLYYPPLWVFPLLRIPYTLTAAVILQCFHVLLGGIGMFVLLRHCCKSSEYALVGAVAFQFFGGFYSNSEHVDIVRAFALSPWLFYVFTLAATGRRNLPRRVVLIPPAVYLLATGGYPGNFLSTLFIMGLYVVLQLGADWLRSKDSTWSFAVMALVAALVALGLSMAFIHIGPTWVQRGELTRNDQAGDLLRMGLWIEHLPGLFLSNRTLPGEVSMTSTYVTLPALIFASLVPLSRLRQHWIEAAIGVIGTFMVAGSRSFLWVTVTTLVPPLRLSRFPTSDYRVFIAIPLVLFSIIGLRAVIQRELSWRNVALRIAFVFVWLLVGLLAVYHRVWDGRVLAAALVASATIALVVYVWRERSALSRAVLAAVVVIVCLDGLRVLPDMNTWRSPEITAWHDSWVPLTKNGELVTYSIFKSLPVSRPPRETTSHVHLFSWRGYLDGSYMMKDIGNTVLRARQIVGSDPFYEQYMLMEWSPLFLEPELARGDTKAVLLSRGRLAEALRSRGLEAAESVEQTSYGVNEIAYKVSLREPKLMVENEVYFPGWQARLVFPDGRQQLKALMVNGVFRAWVLPAGDYRMEARFEFPGKQLYLAVSSAAFIAWFSMLVVTSRSRNAVGWLTGRGPGAG